MKLAEFSNTCWDETPTESRPEVKILTDTSEVYVVESIEFEHDEQNGNDVLWIRVSLDEMRSR